MGSRRIAEEVGEPDLTHRLAQFKVKLEPVKLGGLTKQFGLSPTRSTNHEADWKQPPELCPNEYNRQPALSPPRASRSDWIHDFSGDWLEFW
uniref:Uncharacterized protein n=1 Tax=Solanum tuberosum TaxID=4113 RepID=M1DHI3_SOLTU